MGTWNKKRKDPWPWERCVSSSLTSPDDWNYIKNYSKDHPKFHSKCYDNFYLDLSSKKAAIKASPSVVSLVTYSDDKEIFRGSGTIIKDNGVILTSANLIRCPSSEKSAVAKKIKVMVYLLDGRSYEGELLAHDFYYNIAAVKIQSELLEPACLSTVDDCVSLDPNEDRSGFQLRPHSDDYVLTPGDQVIALGRYFIKPYDIMVAPGQFSITHCFGSFDCKELLQATCAITSAGVGGPLVNRHGDVLGIMIHNICYSPFLPINIAKKWWEHFSNYGKLRRPPLLGMQLTNLYSAHIEKIDKVVQKRPKRYKGVIVEEVIPDSYASVAGFCPGDLIVRCAGRTVGGFLEFYGIMWDNTGKSVDVEVIRASNDASLEFSMTVVEDTQVEHIGE